MSNAQISKEKGNEAFKQGRYADAVGFYTAAIIANREEPTYPLNRAAAYLKLGKFQDAQRDCTTVLKISPKNAKAYFRRGQAWQGLDDLDKAHKDFSEAHQIEPNNQAVTDALNEVSSKLDAKKEKAQASNAAKQSANSSGPPRRRRVPIEIIEPPEGVKAPNSASKLSDYDGNMLKEVSSRPLKPSESQRSGANDKDLKAEPAADPIPPLTRQPQPVSSSSFQEAKQARDTIRPSRIGGGIFRASGPTTVFPTREMNSNSSPSPPSAQQPKTKPPAPKTLSDLVKAWGAQSTPEDQWEVLSTIPPNTFPTFCKSGLEPSFLASIFRTIHAILPKADLPTQVAVRSFLDYVVLVPRFTTIFLFLSKSEKNDVKEVWRMLGVESFEGEPGAWGKLLK